MELTVTKTCLEVLKNLGTAFNDAIFKPETKTGAASAPYVVQNDLGLAVTVMLTEDVFKVVVVCFLYTYVNAKVQCCPIKNIL